MSNSWRVRAERAEDAIRSVRHLVEAWVISDEQLAQAWLTERPEDAARMVLMAKATNRYGEQILGALDGVAPLGNSARFKNEDALGVTP